jgi:hypothetical protein
MPTSSRIRLTNYLTNDNVVVEAYELDDGTIEVPNYGIFEGVSYDESGDYYLGGSLVILQEEDNNNGTK